MKSSPTERMRKQLEFMTCEFSSYDFPDIHDACKILYKLKENSEITYVGFKYNSKVKKYVKTYKVIRIAPKKEVVPKEKVKRTRKRREMPAYVKIWEIIYPEYFTEPQFKVKGVTRFRQDWF